MEWAARDVETDRDPHTDPTWSESEDEDQSITLSESSVRLLTSAFSSTLSNAERRRVRKTFPVPSVSETPEVKSADTELSKIQAFVLNPVGPDCSTPWTRMGTRCKQRRHVQQLWIH